MTAVRWYSSGHKVYARQGTRDGVNDRHAATADTVALAEQIAAALNRAAPDDTPTRIVPRARVTR